MASVRTPVGRQVGKQKFYQIKTGDVATTTPTTYTFTSMVGETWKVEKIEVEAPGEFTVVPKYKDEMGNLVTMDSLYASEFPLDFSRSNPADMQLVITQERDLQIQITNSLAIVATNCRVIVHYIKVWEQEMR